jgi:hypothetical protein
MPYPCVCSSVHSGPLSFSFSTIIQNEDGAIEHGPCRSYVTPFVFVLFCLDWIGSHIRKWLHEQVYRSRATLVIRNIWSSMTH